MIRIVAASALALVSITSLAAPASAETVKVGYTDLDLSSAAGLKALQHRVNAAVDRVCGSADNRDLSAMAQMTSCRKTATAGTNRQIAAVIDMSKRSALRDTGTQVASR